MDALEDMPHTTSKDDELAKDEAFFAGDGKPYKVKRIFYKWREKGYTKHFYWLEWVDGGFNWQNGDFISADLLVCQSIDITPMFQERYADVSEVSANLYHSRVRQHQRDSRRGGFVAGSGHHYDRWFNGHDERDGAMDNNERTASDDEFLAPEDDGNDDQEEKHQESEEEKSDVEEE